MMTAEATVVTQCKRIYFVTMRDRYGEPVRVRVYCGCWDCDGCRGWLRAKWIENYRATLGREEGPVYAGTILTAQQATVSKALNRQGGNYFFLEAGEGERLIVADRSFSGAEEITRDQAVARLEGALTAYSGQWKPGGNSRQWGRAQLTKEPCT